MDRIGSTKFSPVLLRAFKKESELEVWKMKADGAYALLKTYPMCRWSGQLGPKRREGDRQVPEGFYFITPRHMNPNSSYYLSFNVGYPNAYDRAFGRTGSHIMVHGACSSRGCFSMTDEQIAEIYAIVREAFGGGQKAVQLQSLPFRMTPENLAKHRLDKNIAFWRKLKEGVDHFEVSKREPAVMVCNRQYVFNARPKNASGRVNTAGACPSIERDESLMAAVRQKQAEDQAKIAALIKKGTRPIRLRYADGGQHPSFSHVAMVSRPDALARGPIEIALDDRGRPLKSKPTKSKTKLASSGAKGSGSGKSIAVGRSGAQPGLAVAAASAAKTRATTSGKTTAVNKTQQPASLPQNATAYAASTADRPAAKANQPLMRRWLGRLGSFVRSKPAQPVATPASDRKVDSGQQKKAKSEKRADAIPRLIRGAQRLLPPSLTAYAPL